MIHDLSCDVHCAHWNGRWLSGATLEPRPPFHAETPALPGLANTEPVAGRVVAAAIERNRS
jgi:hypothetical protein